MSKRIDWEGRAYDFHRELARIGDTLPPGVRAWLSLSCYGHGVPEYCVGLVHSESKVTGSGYGRTPAAALEAAKLDLQAKYEGWLRTPRLVAAEPRAITGAAS